MVISGARLVDDNREINICVDGKHISNANAANNGPHLSFDNSIVFPGLINSHDHLDFNLFPQLGSRIYNNYTEWGAFIHQQFKQEIANVLKVPLHLRIAWGIYKNLLCGVTTVVNHGERVTVNNPLINIFENTHDLHSPGFENLWKLKINNILKKHLPVVIHAGEGTDKPAKEEISELARWNLMHRDLIAIHAVAMDTQQAIHFKGIVWCPQSNFFLLNKTAAIDQLKKHTAILFGTDSTLTANWCIWDHIDLARKTGMLTDEELYHSVNINAAEIWKLNTGALKPGKNADLIVAKNKNAASAIQSFNELTPANIQLVVHEGNIRLFEQSLLPQLASLLKGRSFSLIKINGTYKYIEGNVQQLIREIYSFLPDFVFPMEVINHQIL